MVGNNASSITQLTTLQAGTITVGTTPATQTTITSTNATGAAINQTLASVGGRIPVLLRQVLALTGAGGGPNGGAVTPAYTFGANGFDGNDAITVTYYSRNGVASSRSTRSMSTLLQVRCRLIDQSARSEQRYRNDFKRLIERRSTAWDLGAHMVGVYPGS